MVGYRISYLEVGRTCRIYIYGSCVPFNSMDSGIFRQNALITSLVSFDAGSVVHYPWGGLQRDQSTGKMASYFELYLKLEDVDRNNVIAHKKFPGR